MNVKEIVAAYLRDKGYDGLYNSDGECACEIGHLCPCEGIVTECHPGYRGPDPLGEGEWGMYGTKEAAEVAETALTNLKEDRHERTQA